MLLSAAIKLEKDMKIHTAWTYLDKVSLRVDPKSKPLGIRDEEDLKGLDQKKNIVHAQIVGNNLS